MKKMKMVAIIQARMGSTRLPGKVMKDIGGETMLARVISRTRRATLLDEIVVATTNKSVEEPIAVECRRLETPIFRGSEIDVLDRYYRCSQAFRAEGVVRITSDCPLIDPELIDLVVRSFLTKRPDYASNTLHQTYPRGLDTEVMTMDALERAWQESSKLYHRAHVTPYIYQNPGLFRLLSIRADGVYGAYRWTVDTPEDLDYVRSIYQKVGHPDAFGWKDAIRVLAQEPELMKLNRHVRQKTLEEG